MTESRGRFSKGLFEIAGDRLGIVARQDGMEQRGREARWCGVHGIYPLAIFRRVRRPLAINRRDS